ncbi:SMP-30/gluconolactonase/LRE family protein [Nocardia huaxiensis]|uniref:SMP-30/gluconolactonase/LRE family protein n=1 Tax=Nocardia huaxiensis TaxID=2755382 RepID=UPI001E4E9031|nr:SMP-30/gluconolactonase/LRE family protein [Nocardia huaxiensis]UFS94870.1 SMP-30/gluconolactonase/LRE family protein [Nocardia huaxiensis]
MKVSAAQWFSRIIGLPVALGFLGVAVLVPAGPAEAQDPLFPATLTLPAGFRPEGIAIGALPFAYVGSMADGSIYRADLVTGQGGIFGAPTGTPALGLRLDQRGRLFVAGGTGGDARVLDAWTGATLATYEFATQPDTFVNDLVFTPEGAWFTDSSAAVLYHLPIAADGALPPPGAVLRIPLSGDIAYVPQAFNANGIVRTPDGTGLIIVQSVTGHLFHVDRWTGVTRRIDLGDETLVHGDGLFLDGNTLYAVENRRNAIAVITLDPAGTAGTVERRITDSRFDVPATIAAFGGRLYLPNARFDTVPEPSTPYSVVAVGR